MKLLSLIFLNNGVLPIIQAETLQQGPVMFTSQRSYIPEPLPDNSAISNSAIIWHPGHPTFILPVTTSPLSFSLLQWYFVISKYTVFSTTHLPGLFRFHYRVIFSILFICNPKASGFVDLRALCTTQHWHQTTRPKTPALWEHKRSKSPFNKM